MQKRDLHLGLILVAWMLASCTVVSRGSPPPDDIAMDDAALVYGYVEAEDDVIEQVDLLEFGKVYIPPFRKPPRVMVFDNGMFLAENIKPGKYVLAGFRSERNHYNMARSKRKAYQHIVNIKPGDMEYIGAYNVRVTRKGRIEFGDFTVTALQRPGERDILKHLYQVTEGTAWQNKIARRLRQLRQF